MQLGRTRGDARHDTAPLEMELDKAYHRGRNDAHGEYVPPQYVQQPGRYVQHSARYVQRRNGSHPLLVFAVFMVALAGAVLIALSIQEGSFSKGGALVDQQMKGEGQQASAAERVEVIRAEPKPKARVRVKTKGKAKVQPAEGDWVVARR